MYKLITAANSSRAYQLKSKLNSDYVLLGDYHDLPDLLLKTGKVLRLPDPKKTSYTHEMLSLCIDKDIDTIYALREQEKQLLLNAEQLFQEYNIKIQVTDNEI
ncbi:MAG: hypothetical protein JWP37_4263 [Mucilaginibacter sp.]|nr:hypothetical protein [Mucilaginibacter sp.]